MGCNCGGSTQRVRTRGSRQRDAADAPKKERELPARLRRTPQVWTNRARGN